MQIESQVMATISEPRFGGLYTAHFAQDTGVQISAGLMTRLNSYAQKRMAEAGFGPLLATCRAEVYTLDGDERPSDRCYTVKFITPAGGYIEVCGIHMANGWPSLDMGLEIGED